MTSKEALERIKLHQYIKCKVCDERMLKGCCCCNNVLKNSEEFETIENELKNKEMDYKKAFKIVNEFINKYYPFSHGKNWDKKNGNLHFILGIYSLQNYIEALADENFDINNYIKELEK